MRAYLKEFDANKLEETVHFLRTSMGALCYLLDGIKPSPRSIQCIFRAKALTKIHRICGKRTALLSGLSALLDCAVIARALLDDLVHHRLYKRIVETMGDARE